MKTIQLFLTLGLALWAAAPSAFAKVNVFACEPEWKALVEELGGEYVKAFSATTAFQDPHYIEARPSLIAKTRRSDLLVCTGAELEIGWLPLLLRQSGNAKIQRGKPGYFLAASQVERIEIPTKLDRSQGDVHASGNPHVFWDPYRLQTIAKALSERLQIIDAANKQAYQQKLIQFSEKWAAAISRWEQQILPLKNKKVVVYHKNWSYLLAWLDMEAIGDLEPKPGLPPTSSHLASLLKVVRSQQLTAILFANYQNKKGAHWLSKKSGIPAVQLPFTIGGNKESSNLIALYDNVLSTLLKYSY